MRGKKVHQLRKALIQRFKITAEDLATKEDRQLFKKDSNQRMTLREMKKLYKADQRKSQNPKLKEERNPLTLEERRRYWEVNKQGRSTKRYPKF